MPDVQGPGPSEIHGSPDKTDHHQGQPTSYRSSLDVYEQAMEISDKLEAWVPAVEEKKNENVLPPKSYKQVLEHIRDGDLELIKTLFESGMKPSSVLSTVAVNPNNDTVLHLAVVKGAPIKFIDEVVRWRPNDLESLADRNFTVLHYAAMVGNREAAEFLVGKNRNLPKFVDDWGRTPLELALESAHKDIVWYLLRVAKSNHPSLITGESGVYLLRNLIIAEFYDAAIYLLKSNVNLAIQQDYVGCSALFDLAKKPHSFPSGNQLNFLQSMLYKLTYYVECVNVDVEKPAADTERTDMENPAADHEYPTYERRKSQRKFKFLQHILDTKMMHVQAVQLAEILFEEMAKSETWEDDSLLDPIWSAAKLGIHELVWGILKVLPHAIWHKDSDQRSIFHLAVMFRKEKVYNLIYQMSLEKHYLLTLEDAYRNNILHLAGMLGPSYRISGAALHMQREFQWFKEVENIVPPSFKVRANNGGKTPREVFTEEHKDLVKQGKEWMKSTATSCTVVAALVITIAFTAGFTLPGGSNSDGYPIFLNHLPFLIFSVSNALALFSSSTSLLMFLGILTSRYSEEDFLRALPMRLCIGLATLFLSIAFMLAAFGSALHIVLVHRLSWVAAPIILLACIPLTLFVFLQFPLLFEMVSSTFGPSIFRQQDKEILY